MCTVWVLIKFANQRMELTTNHPDFWELNTVLFPRIWIYHDLSKTADVLHQIILEKRPTINIIAIWWFTISKFRTTALTLVPNIDLGSFHDPSHFGLQKIMPSVPVNRQSTISAWWLGTMEWIMTFHSVGNGKSSQLTFTHIFFRGVGLNHQPDFFTNHFFRDPSVFCKCSVVQRW